LEYIVEDPDLITALAPFTFSSDCATTAITYSAQLADLTPLPPFIVFDPLTLTLTVSGATNEDAGSYQVLVKGVDGLLIEASTEFEVMIVEKEEEVVIDVPVNTGPPLLLGPPSD